MADREEILRRLTLGDVTCLQSLIDERRLADGAPALDFVAEALVKLRRPHRHRRLRRHLAPHRNWRGGPRRRSGAADQVVDALIVLAPVIGGTRVVAVAPKLALATGFDVASAIELH